MKDLNSEYIGINITQLTKLKESGKSPFSNTYVLRSTRTPLTAEPNQIFFKMIADVNWGDIQPNFFVQIDMVASNRTGLEYYEATFAEDEVE